VKDACDIAIVGGGVMGLAIAYNLALRGTSDVIVLEGSYLASGASGRNGGGIRQQWSTQLNIQLMQESVALCKRFARDLGVNIWLRQGGYLFLARSEKETERLERNIELQNRHGVPTRMLTPAEAQEIVPELDVRGFVAASYNPTDGILFPWPFLWGYADGAARRGVEIHTHTRVLGIEHGGGEFLLHTSGGELRARRVVNAAGAWSPLIARMVGVELPNWPVRHEILSSEPLKPFLRPMVSVLASGLYFSQSMRGEVVGGITVHEERKTEIEMGSTLRFAAMMADAMIALIPRFGELKIVRQWAGPYDMTEDGNPILGEPPGVPGFYLCCGFMGHGFMMAPIMGQLYADWLTGGARHSIFDRCRLSRFAEGTLEKEDFIIG
jgi:sarcosine oxidase subunit beta